MYSSTFNPQNSQNPFPINLGAALGTFFQTLAAVQRQNLTVASIEQAYNRALEGLNEQWDDLQGLARDGLVERVEVQLNDFMKDYAAQKALYQFIDGAANGWVLNPTTPGLHHALAAKLVQKHTHLTSLLIQILTAGMKAREEAQAQSAYQLAETRVQHAEHSIEREFDRNRDLHGLVMQTLGTHDDARKSLDDARQSLRMAMSAAQQVQDVFPKIMGPAVDLVKATHQQIPSYVEETARANQHRRSGKLLWFFLTLGVLIGLPLVAFLFLHFL